MLRQITYWFSQYHAGPIGQLYQWVLGWPRDGACYLMQERDQRPSINSLKSLNLSSRSSYIVVKGSKKRDCQPTWSTQCEIHFQPLPSTQSGTQGDHRSSDSVTHTCPRGHLSASQPVHGMDQPTPDRHLTAEHLHIAVKSNKIKYFW